MAKIYGIVLMVLCLCSCTDKAPKKASSAEVQITVQEGFDAILRSEPRAKKICYDGDRYGWFVYWDKVDIENSFDGWYYTYNVEFYHLSTNNSWFITGIPSNNWIQVYPDITNLPCRER